MGVFGQPGSPPGVASVGDWVLAGRFQNTDGVGNVTKISAYLHNDTDATAAKWAIYADSSGSPGALLGYTDAYNVSAYATGWADFTGGNLSSISIANNTYYWIAFWNSGQLYYGRNTTGGTHAYHSLAYTGTFPDPLNEDGTDVSLYYVTCTFAVSSSIEQKDFRFRNDDDNEASATWKANQDVNINLAADTAFRLRFLLKATGNPDSIDAQAEARVKPSGGAFGSWEKIN